MNAKDNALYIYAPLGALRKRNRLAKIANICLQMDVPIVFFGWERTRGEHPRFRFNDDKVQEFILLRGGGYATSLARAMYPIWMMVVFLAVLRRRRGDVCLCLGWETAFPALIASKVTGCRIIFDDADRFSMSIKFPKIIRRWLEPLEEWASRSAELHIVPSLSRYSWKCSSMLELKNTPTRLDLANAISYSVPRNPGDSVFTVYINGWINWDTGSPTFLKAISLLSNRRETRIRFILAGRVVSPEGEALKNHPSVEYLGDLPRERALAQYFHSDLVLTFYDPSVPINRYAESNKWGDCVFTLTPFVVNSEVETAQRYIRAGVATCIPYADSEGLADLISLLSRDPGRMTAMRASAELLRDTTGYFDDQLGNHIRRVMCFPVA
jgi:hypothetical protein